MRLTTERGFCGPGYSASNCGYCTPSGSGQRSEEKTSKSYGIWANNITAETYQQLLDRGWRRSGSYIYRPDCSYTGTCCPQIAIRVAVEEFRPRSDQRRAISHLQQLVRQVPEGSTSRDTHHPINSSSRKGKYRQQWDAERQWKAIEWNEAEEYDWEVKGDDVASQKQVLKRVHQERISIARAERSKKKREKEKKKYHTTLLPLLSPKRRRFETILRKADSTMEKYHLFRSYQMKIHGESETKVSSKEGFERFLCQSPLMSFIPEIHSTSKARQDEQQAIDVKSNSAIAYDLYHMEYRYEGRLVAVGVIDILPRSISSVYLFYDPDYAHLHLGKVSAIREIALVKQIQRKKGMEGVRYYNLGLYVHSCAKMKYKADYHPSEILDPLTCEWLPYSKVKIQLDRGVRYDFLQHTADLPVPSKLFTPKITKLDEEEDSGTQDEDEDDEKNLPLPPPPGIMDPTELPIEMLARCLIFENGRINLLSVSVIFKRCYYCS